MKRITLACFAAVFFIAACNNEKTSEASTESTSADTSTKAEAKVETPAAPLDSATMAKNWETYMTPGDMHKMMKSWSGTWDGTINSWMAPGAPPMTFKTVSTFKMVLGDRYQQGIYKGQMMGQPFEGMGTIGYDNARKVFESTWIDNMGTGTMKLEGPWDEATKSITFTGPMIDPSTLKETTMRQTIKIVDDNTQVITMFGPGPDGKEFKMMEITDVRRK